MPRAGTSPAWSRPKLGIVYAPVGGIDHNPGSVGDLVDQLDADYLADQRCLARAALEQRHAGRSTLDAGFPEGALHHLELVSPLAELSELAFGSSIEGPYALLPFLGEAEALQGLQAADPQCLLHGVGLLGNGHHQDAVLGSGDQGSVEPGQALLPDLVEELLHPPTSVSGPSSRVMRAWARARTPWEM